MIKRLKYLLLVGLLFSSGYLVSAEINDLNVTDASNTARFPEGMAPSAVNDGARALEGLLARHHKDNNGSLVSTGSVNVFALAANQAISSYYDGLSLVFEVATANTSTATLNVDAVGAQAIVWPDGTALSSGDMPAEAKVTVRYDLGNTRWLLSTVSVAPSADPTPDDLITTRGDIIRGSSGAAAERLAVGAADTFLGSDGTDAAYVAAATQAEQETGTATNKPVTPGRQQSHPSAAKCWGDVSVSAGTPTLDASYNITSITDTAAGQLTVTLDVDFSTSDYVIVTSTFDSTGTSSTDQLLAVVRTQVAGSFLLITFTTAGATGVDPEGWYFICMGDQ